MVELFGTPTQQIFIHSEICARKSNSDPFFIFVFAFFYEKEKSPIHLPPPPLPRPSVTCPCGVHTHLFIHAPTLQTASRPTGLAPIEGSLSARAWSRCRDLALCLPRVTKCLDRQVRDTRSVRLPSILYAINSIIVSLDISSFGGSILSSSKLSGQPTNSDQTRR